VENRNGLVVGGNVTIASGTAEREAALELIDFTKKIFPLRVEHCGWSAEQ